MGAGREQGAGQASHPYSETEKNLPEVQAPPPAMPPHGGRRGGKASLSSSNEEPERSRSRVASLHLFSPDSKAGRRTRGRGPRCHLPQRSATSPSPRRLLGAPSPLGSPPRLPFCGETPPQRERGSGRRRREARDPPGGLSARAPTFRRFALLAAGDAVRPAEKQPRWQDGLAAAQGLPPSFSRRVCTAASSVAPLRRLVPGNAAPSRSPVLFEKGRRQQPGSRVRLLRRPSPERGSSAPALLLSSALCREAKAARRAPLSSREGAPPARAPPPARPPARLPPPPLGPFPPSGAPPSWRLPLLSLGSAQRPAGSASGWLPLAEVSPSFQAAHP
ncbi:Hypothetical predicted protein [Podarcis lilfordi]|uniref:Uncharacterized protein n=1 Tax=Podarcis lilfordi TaxID=74358 RepID=A0AA35PFA2_9SAUR|nr:Hypothetical predicted protein [Podarcis lilfordi]